MTRAICQKCGDDKTGSFVPCPSCGFDPATDDELIAALLLSDHYQDEETLEDNRVRIRAGKILRVPDEIREQFLPVIQEVKPTLGLAPPRSTANLGAAKKATKNRRESFFSRLDFAVRVGFFYQRLNRASLKSSLLISRSEEASHISADDIYSIAMLASWISIFLSVSLAKSMIPGSIKNQTFLTRVAVAKMVLPKIAEKVLALLYADTTSLRNSENIGTVFRHFFEDPRIGKYLSASLLDPSSLRCYLPSRCSELWQLGDDATVKGSFRSFYSESLTFCQAVLEEVIVKHPLLQNYNASYAAETLIKRYQAHVVLD